MRLSDGKLLGSCMQGTQEGFKREGLREGIMYILIVFMCRPALGWVGGGVGGEGSVCRAPRAVIGPLVSHMGVQAHRIVRWST